MSLRISLSDIQYPHAARALISRLELEIAAGELYLVKGGNGSGKTSLLNCVAGVVPEHIQARGNISIWMDDTALHELPLRKKSHLQAYMMTEPVTQLLFPSLEKELCFALENRGLAPLKMQDRINAAIDRFGLGTSLEHDPHLLSQGQKKLLLLAVCHAMDTPLLLLDEPSTSLSSRGRELLFDWVGEQLKLGKIIIAAEHHHCLNSLAAKIIDLDELCQLSIL